MSPKIIKTRAEYEAALTQVEALMDAPPGSSLEGQLELWAVLVEKYEEEQFPIQAPDPVTAIRFRMEQSGLRPRDLTQYISSRSKISEVLSGKRPLSLSMIRALHSGLKIPAEILVKPSPVSKSSRRNPSKGTRRNQKKALGHVGT